MIRWILKKTSTILPNEAAKILAPGILKSKDCDWLTHTPLVSLVVRCSFKATNCSYALQLYKHGV